MELFLFPIRDIQGYGGVDNQFPMRGALGTSTEIAAESFDCSLMAVPAMYHIVLNFLIETPVLLSTLSGSTESPLDMTTFPILQY